MMEKKRLYLDTSIMKTKPFKVMKWLRSIRDEHFENTKNTSWQEDHNHIRMAAEDTHKKIDALKTKETIKPV